MLVFFKENLVLLANPKTGTTALSTALAKDADIVFDNRRKHVNAAFLHRKFAPFLSSAFDLTPERAAVIRDPLDVMRSWFRYRQRTEIAESRRSTRETSFEEFVADVLSDDPPPHARIGRQSRFLTLKTDGRVPLHHLFAYEAQPRLLAFLSDRFQREITLPVQNASPNAPAEIGARTEARFRHAFAADYAIYQRVLDADGHLHQLLD
ncbi:hypothetical protein [Rhodalgimonas zhirmunskyi]|uniref:Sulfotransferase family protein n=1 Tax=Rhodalgimonas zhirmunskyi TaxID=2964767 RepID=A0AAJ1X6G7_9RHOB|nr:hypothetical protein [Rhodoalgimonas zhirmunskyi]MDQ2095496.1 hypothetical protein [Rhodoalgimonas zhirmunskyi]